MALDKFQPYLFVSAGEQSNKFLTPVISPDGIASFQAQRAQDLTGLTVRIDPIQAGTGDPSPTNIRPISGRTGMTVTAVGKNLFDGMFSQPSSSRIESSTITLLPGTYTYSQKYNGTPTWGVYVLRPDNTEIAKVFNANKVTFTLSQEESVIIRVYYANGITPENITEAQIEIGSTATPYTPYVAPTTYPVNWQTEAGTVYGGTLDVVSGVLTVTHGLVAFDGSENWVLSGVSTEGCYVQLNDLIKTNNYTGKILCNKLSTFRTRQNGAYKSAEYGITAYWGTSFPNQNWIYAKNERTPTAASFKAWLSENPITICYELATPQTYQLTGAEVRTIAGYNQIYSDAGQVIDIKF